jgi:serine protease Do
MNKAALRIGILLSILALVAITPSCVDKINYDTTKNIKNKIINSSVCVKALEGLGAGTIVRKDKNKMYVLTCFHVIATSFFDENSKNMCNIEYELLDKTYKVQGTVSYLAKIIKIDIDNDLALLEIYINDKNLVAIKLAKIEPIRGDIVYSVGSPLGLERTISTGILSNFIEGFYVSDNTTTFGNSGGGLYNKSGELIGVPARVFVYFPFPPIPESGLGMSIELKIIKKFLIPYVWSN